MSNIVIPDGGTIGSASDTDAITISSSGIVTMASGNGYRFGGMRVFTASGPTTTTTGTFTKSPNVTALYVIVTGGGGGGASGYDNYNSGGVGSAGATAIKWLTSGIDGNIDYQIGGGGTGGTADTDDATDGADSFFGPSSNSPFTRIIGGKGLRGRSGARTDTVAKYTFGGDATGGDINISGGDGSSEGGGSHTDEPGFAFGGASYWGGGGMAGQAVNAALKHGSSAKAYGSGGGGGREHVSAESFGGNGMAGIIVVYEYIS